MGKKKSESLIDGLPPRKRKYIAERAKGKSKMNAALSAGYSDAMAKAASAKIETPDVREAFKELIRKAIPASRIVQRLAEGIDAMETEFAKCDGAITDTRDVIAWGERREYLKLAAQFGGYITDAQDKKYPTEHTQVILIGVSQSPSPEPGVMILPPA